MRLLVSVRSAEEAVSAAGAGADIVDAKEPARGSLGPVAAPVLRRIAAALPAAVPLSAALGDFRDPDRAAAAVAGVPPLRGRATVFLKLGFQGVAIETAVGAIVSAAVAAARARPDGAVIVPAAYADHVHAGTVSPEAIAALASVAGAAGVLVDTWAKEGLDLFHWMTAPRLERWVAAARGRGLLTAVAGSLGPAAIPAVLGAGADVMGVRGAACEGGRGGRLAGERIAALLRALGRTSEGASVAV